MSFRAKHAGRLEVACLIAATFLSLLPFLNKPIHVDDPLFVWTAQQIVKHPLDFYGFPVLWARSPIPMYLETKNPPLTCYWLALGGWLFGWGELALHGWMSIPAVAAILGARQLATRCGVDAAGVALATLATPVFMVSATTLMADVPMLAFWCWACWAWMRGCEENSAVWLGVAATLSGMCIWTKYFGIALIPLLALYSIVRVGRPSLSLAWLIVPVLFVLAYEAATHQLYGVGMFSAAVPFALNSPTESDPMSSEGALFFSSLRRAWVGVLFLGGCCLPLALANAAVTHRRGALAWFLAGAIVLAMLALSSTSYRLGLYHYDEVNFLMVAHQIVLGGAGLLILGKTARSLSDEWRHPISLCIGIWILGVAVFAALLNWTCNGRSMLPLTPAVAILVAGCSRRENRTAQWYGALVVGWLISMWVASGDACFANTARRAAAELVAEARSAAADSGGQVYFEGHWGWQYYAELAGAKAVDFSNATIEPQDVILLPYDNYGMLPLGPEITPLRYHREVAEDCYVHTISSNGGFYASTVAPVPFFLGPKQSQHFDAVGVTNTLRLESSGKQGSDEGHPSQR